MFFVRMAEPYSTLMKSSRQSIDHEFSQRSSKGKLLLAYFLSPTLSIKLNLLEKAQQKISSPCKQIWKTLFKQTMTRAEERTVPVQINALVVEVDPTVLDDCSLKLR